MKKIVLGLVVSFAVIALLLAVTERQLAAEGSGSDMNILSKLDNILAGQKAMLDDMAYIKEELKIIKIRVTQSQ